MRPCPGCGLSIENDAPFCPTCGWQAAATATPQASTSGAAVPDPSAATADAQAPETGHPAARVPAPVAEVAGNPIVRRGIARMLTTAGALLLLCALGVAFAHHGYKSALHLGAGAGLVVVALVCWYGSLMIGPATLRPGFWRRRRGPTWVQDGLGGWVNDDDD
jgi:hypothetical protein